MRHRSGVLIGAVVTCCALSPAASASEHTPAITLLKGSALTVQYPDGTAQAFPIRGRLIGTLPKSPAMNTDVRLSLRASSVAVRIRRGAQLCSGEAAGSTWSRAYAVAQQQTGAPPSAMTFAASGQVTLSWSTYGSTSFTDCAPQNPAQLDTASSTITLTGRPGRLGLRRLVLTGRQSGIVVSGGTASVSLRLITRVDF